MTGSALPEALEVVPLPDGAVEVDGWDGRWQSSHELAVAALRQELRRRQLALPLGPELDPADPDRLLSLSRFSLQLASAGLLADQVAVQQRFWRDAATAPQLLLAALVDEENGVVQLQGVLTGPELQQQLAAAEQGEGCWLVDTSAFRGGLDRLLALVQLLDPQVLPRLALSAEPSRSAVLAAASEWLRGQLDQALVALGAELVPAAAQASFRSASSTAELEASNPLAVLAIPLGLTPDGSLVTGEEARQCIETFQLLLIPSCRQGGGERADQLILQLSGRLSGDLLPDGLSVSAEQGRLRQSASSEQSTALSLTFSGQEAINVVLRAASGSELQLPPLQLPQP